MSNIFYLLSYIVIVSPVFYSKSISDSFHLKLFSFLSSSNLQENIIFSPISLYQALSLLANGARGSTQSEIITSLNHLDIIGVNYNNMEIIKLLKQNLSLANAILSKFTPSDSFLQINKKYEAYAGELTSVEQVNEWCKEKTNGLIKDIINNISTIELIILNAVSFKGKWYHNFKSKDTYKIQFYNEDSSQSTVKMMKQIHTYNYYEDSTVQIIEMKYDQEDVSAIIILPNKKINLNKYINEVFSYDLLWKYNKELKPCDVEIHLPKFTIESKFELNEQLKELGITSAFDPSTADFYNITPHGGLYVSDVIQKAFIKVDEEGTEAAVATAVIMVRGIDIKFIPDKTMVVDRPFLFMIKHKKLEKEMLFIGKIVHLNNVSDE